MIPDFLFLPNLLTISRLLLLPLLVWTYSTHRYDWSLILLIYGALSDLFDGSIARYLEQRTKIGAILDPIADKLFMFTCFLMLGLSRQIPWILVFLVILRDFYIFIGVLILKLRAKKVYIRPTALSKLNTFFQLGILCLAMNRIYVEKTIDPVFWLRIFNEKIAFLLPIFFYLSVFLTLASGFHYTIIGLGLYRGGISTPISKDQKQIDSL